jgi:hypothetical protein
MKRPTFSIRHLFLAVGGSAFAAMFMTHAIRQKHARAEMKAEIRLLGGRITTWKDDNGLVSILPTSWRPYICNVKLKNCKVDPALLERIDSLGYHVVGLDLTGTPISDTDLGKLRALPSFSCLRDLGLAKTNVSVESVRTFEAARPACVVHGNRSNFKTEL